MDVSLDRAQADGQPDGNLLIRSVLRQESQDLQFTLAQVFGKLSGEVNLQHPGHPAVLLSLDNTNQFACILRCNPLGQSSVEQRSQQLTFIHESADEALGFSLY